MVTLASAACARASASEPNSRPSEVDQPVALPVTVTVVPPAWEACSWASRSVMKSWPSEVFQ